MRSTHSLEISYGCKMEFIARHEKHQWNDPDQPWGLEIQCSRAHHMVSTSARRDEFIEFLPTGLAISVRLGLRAWTRFRGHLLLGPADSGLALAFA